MEQNIAIDSVNYNEETTKLFITLNIDKPKVIDIEYLTDYLKPLEWVYWARDEHTCNTVELCIYVETSLGDYRIVKRYGQYCCDHSSYDSDLTFKGDSLEEVREWADKHWKGLVSQLLNEILL